VDYFWRLRNPQSPLGRLAFRWSIMRADDACGFRVELARITTHDEIPIDDFDFAPSRRVCRRADSVRRARAKFRGVERAAKPADLRSGGAWHARFSDAERDAPDAGSGAVYVGAGFAAAAGRAAGRGHQIHLDQHNLSGDHSRLLDLRSGAIHGFKAGLRDGGACPSSWTI
jgi:hypothetical protein